MLNLHNQEATAPFPISKMEDHSFSLSCAVYSIKLQVPTIFDDHLLQPQSKDTPCHDKRDFANMDWSYEVSTSAHTYIHTWRTHNILVMPTNCKNDTYWMQENFEETYGPYRNEADSIVRTPTGEMGFALQWSQISVNCHVQTDAQLGTVESVQGFRARLWHRPFTSM